ncbi:2-C-methyl-D-erythritol 4-phosphate cytidylyltransferase [Vibrio sp. qd031]|uniref:2-C-methyl-D-erythritol 4-phosphate cytidylyltransferase n=1 Tax=Vibrio sp. qd031 TaxID=1603038 RepID=UPI000A100D88|nr:2-C-methyl-D-erythritol 4-phosphate cytidylyltransferase [Vibrio sp. qd031]ORT52143.1 2-C-methyl-D-erythritol 4-phosphate cytidylyltransferase [Vibrio sp. qd031]
MPESTLSIVAIVPAAGVGSRMQADRPKQYLTLQNKTILEHTVHQLLAHPLIHRVIIALSDQDPYFDSLPLSNDQRVTRVCGGKERADSVLSGLYAVSDPQNTFALVHDAARPNVSHRDISRLIDIGVKHPVGAILASPVKDTMKRSNRSGEITQTVDREKLWHALTPQLFNAEQLKIALEHGLNTGAVITDEASAMENIDRFPSIVAGRSDNIKVTSPEDLELMTFYLSKPDFQETTDV